MTDRPLSVVEIPESLLVYLRPGTRLGVALEATGNRWRGDDGECDTYTLTGEAVTDSQALAMMNVPDHESCVEVGLQRKDIEGAPASGSGV